MPEKPKNSKDVIRALEIVSNCHEFDPFPPLPDLFVVSSDTVGRDKRGILSIKLKCFVLSNFGNDIYKRYAFQLLVFINQFKPPVLGQDGLLAITRVCYIIQRSFRFWIASSRSNIIIFRFADSVTNL